MLEQSLLQQIGIRRFELSNPNVFSNVPKSLIAEDVLRNLPIFVIRYNQELAKHYLFNLFGYLRYKSYPCYWDGEDLTSDEEKRKIVIGCSSDSVDLTAYPSAVGKETLWKQISPYVKKLTCLQLDVQHKNDVHIILDSPLDNHWLYNLAGFLDFNKIKYSWYQQDASKKSVFIGKNKSEYTQYTIEIDKNIDEHLQKKQVFGELIKNNYVVQNIDGSYSLGLALND
jgi:hypothetical protein